MKKKLMAGLLVMVFVFSVFTFSGCGNENQIIIGTKDFNESIVLGEIFAQVIEAKTDISVKRKLNLGGTFICFEAIKKGDIDLYPEYTGTGITAHLKLPVISDTEEGYNVCKDEFDKQFNIAWLDPLGFNNTYAIAVTKEIAAEYNLSKCSDLKVNNASQNISFGGEHEFFNRPGDGFDGFCDLYDVSFKGDTIKMNVALKYKAIGDNEMDATDAYTTDSEILEYELVVLEDDLGFFPPYIAAPIIKNETLLKFPELKDVLNLLSGKITNTVMTQLNYNVMIDKQSVKVVAENFLTEAGII